MTCNNCGAPLKGQTCEYCGCNVGVNYNVLEHKYNITLWGGETIECYMSEVEVKEIDSGAYRDANGFLHRAKPMVKRKLTFIEY